MTNCYRAGPNPPFPLPHVRIPSNHVPFQQTGNHTNTTNEFIVTTRFSYEGSSTITLDKFTFSLSHGWTFHPEPELITKHGKLFEINYQSILYSL